ncbi:protein of unknown function [Methylorubrum extorquens]|uniref:Uncharacterized protein n=1 Tax=Methylorubrum extorquens TaxID=408 RepID=A0A2N9AWE1_METEX|nr:protein of unknown function [Methylorubrum extorquens]
MRPLQLDGCQEFGGPGALERALGLLDRGLEQVRLNPVERRPLLDRLSLLELDGIQKADNARAHLDTTNRLDAPNEVERLIDRLALGESRPDRDCSGRGRLRLRLRLQAEPSDEEQGTQPREKAEHGHPSRRHRHPIRAASASSRRVRALRLDQTGLNRSGFPGGSNF